MQNKKQTGIEITFPDGSVEFIPDAVSVDTQNFHEGMFDFYDARGNLLRQIDMGSGVQWETVTADDKPEEGNI